MSATATQAGKGKESAKDAGKKSPIVLILLIVIVLLAAGGGGAAFYFYKQAQHPAAPVIPPPVFFALDPFTVNLANDDSDDSHYLHIGLTLKLTDQETEHQLTTYMPEIRSRIILLLSSRKSSDLATLDGKNALSKDLRTAIDQPFARDGKSVKIDSVLLTDFVIQ